MHGKHSIVKPIGLMAVPESLNKNGAMVFEFPPEINIEAFVMQLREAASNWFRGTLQTLLANSHVKMQEEPYKQGKVAWDKLRTEHQQALVSAFVANIHGKNPQLGLQPSLIQTLLGKLVQEKQLHCPDMDALSKFILKCVSFAMMGGKASAMGTNCHDAWTIKGFGFWAKFVPDIGLQITMLALSKLRDIGLTATVPGHFPHLIFKRPGAPLLGAHTDQINPAELIKLLRDHGHKSTHEWVKQRGCQMIAHLEGGRGEDDGATFVLGPMTPQKLLICLTAYKESDTENAKTWYKSKGKVDIDCSVETIALFNKALREKGTTGEERTAVGLLPIAPTKGDKFDRCGHMILWPVGWIHGSFGTKKNSQCVTSRISLTTPIGIRGSAQSDVATRNVKRVPDRLYHMAMLSAPDVPDDVVYSAEDALRLDTVVYADGATHMHPECVSNYIRGQRAVDANARREQVTRVGAFHAINIQPETVRAYLLMLAPQEETRLFPTKRGADDQKKPAKDKKIRLRAEPLLQKAAIAMTMSEFDCCRIIKVKQPWASALVNGFKDCENRAKPLHARNEPFPMFMLIASSVAVPAKKDMSEVEADLTKDGFSHAASLMSTADPADFKPMCGRILGIVRVIKCVAPDAHGPWVSTWRHPGDHTYFVSGAWKFKTPIELAPNDGIQTQSKLATAITNYPQHGYKRRVVEALRDVELIGPLRATAIMRRNQ